jgi:superfamily I DNA/RNA helicase
MTPDAVTFNAPDVVVHLAAAGAGKTTAIMDEMTKLLTVYRPDEIAFVTYTRKGVAYGIERALQTNPQLTADDLVYFKTLHALCFRELGLKYASIITRADMEKFNQLVGFNVTLRDANELQTDDDKLLTRYDAIRSGSTKGVFVHGSFDEERYHRLVRAYEEFKARNYLVDFYDCLLKFRDAGQPVRGIKAAFIDEAQDLTMLQWEVCQLAFSACEKVRISGDDYQALFSYLGASPRTLVALAGRYRTVKHESSYRLSRAVYRFARGVTGLISDKVEKDFKPVKDLEGFVNKVADRRIVIHRIREDLAEHGVQPYRWYLLFRNNCFIDEIADLLEQYTIPYHTAKGFCLDVRMLSRIRRYYNFRKKGFSSGEALKAFCEKFRITDIDAEFTESDLIPANRMFVYFDYVQKYGLDALEEMAEKEPFLLLSTVHRVKGSEADYVGVFLDCTRRVEENALVHVDEELRVLYVACTRSRIGLYLISGTGRYGLDKLVDMINAKSA